MSTIGIQDLSKYLGKYYSSGKFDVKLISKELNADSKLISHKLSRLRKEGIIRQVDRTTEGYHVYRINEVYYDT